MREGGEREESEGGGEREKSEGGGEREKSEGERGYEQHAWLHKFKVHAVIMLFIRFRVQTTVWFHHQSHSCSEYPPPQSTSPQLSKARKTHSDEFIIITRLNQLPVETCVKKLHVTYRE